METRFVKAVFDIDCEWAGLPPIYRIYVNDELFTERTWIWTDSYLEEILQIESPPGQCRIRLESVGPDLAQFSIRNHRIEYGSGRWIDHEYLEIKA